MTAIDVHSPFCTVTVRRNPGTKEKRPITDRIVSFKFTDSGTKKTSKVDITLDAEDGLLWGDDTLMRKGSLLECQFGYPGAFRFIGDFAIKKVRGNRQTISITAYPDKRNRMMRHKRSRQWENMRRSDVARTVFGEHGITRILVDQSPDVLPTITQVNETDWYLLRRLADLENAELYIDANGAHFEAPKRTAKPTRLLRYVQGQIGLGMIQNWSVDDVSTSVPGRIVMRGYDPLKGKEFEAIANGESVGVVALSDGVDIVDPDQGDRQGGQVGTELIMPTGARSLEEASSEALSLYKKMRYAAVKVKLTTIGDPWISSRTITALEGIGALLDGRWWTKNVVHTISGGGYGCEVTLNKDGLNKKKSKKPKATAGAGDDLLPGNYDQIKGLGKVRKGLYSGSTPGSGTS